MPISFSTTTTCSRSASTAARITSAQSRRLSIPRSRASEDPSTSRATTPTPSSTTLRTCGRRNCTRRARASRITTPTTPWRATPWPCTWSSSPRALTSRTKTRGSGIFSRRDWPQRACSSRCPRASSRKDRKIDRPRAADAAALGPCPALRPSGPASSAENGDDQPCGARDERRDEYPVVALPEAFSHHEPERALHHGVRHRDDGERGEGEDHGLDEKPATVLGAER